MTLLGRRPTILAVVLLSELPVRRCKFAHQPTWSITEVVRQFATVGQLLQDDAIVFSEADLRTVRHKVRELAIQLDKCSAGVLVALVGGDSLFTWHCAASILSSGGCTPESDL